MKLAEEALKPFLEANKALYLTIEGRNKLLELNNRRLTDVHASVSTLHHIEEANLSNNVLTTIPPDIKVSYNLDSTNHTDIAIVEQPHQSRFVTQSIN